MCDGRARAFRRSVSRPSAAAPDNDAVNASSVRREGDWRAAKITALVLALSRPSAPDRLAMLGVSAPEVTRIVEAARGLAGGAGTVSAVGDAVERARRADSTASFAYAALDVFVSEHLPSEAVEEAAAPWIHAMQWTWPSQRDEILQVMTATGARVATALIEDFRRADAEMAPDVAGGDDEDEAASTAAIDLALRVRAVRALVEELRRALSLGDFDRLVTDLGRRGGSPLPKAFPSF